MPEQTDHPHSEARKRTAMVSVRLLPAERDALVKAAGSPRKTAAWMCKVALREARRGQ